MRAAADFSSVMRGGCKSGRATVVVYAAPSSAALRRVGMAVPKTVGGAVIRNRVRRRLRAILAGEIGALPEGTGVVVRALPPAADATFAQLASDVRGALSSAVGKVRR